MNTEENNLIVENMGLAYDLAYKYYNNTKTGVFPGGISNLMLGKDNVSEGYIYSYYTYTKIRYREDGTKATKQRNISEREYPCVVQCSNIS